MSCVAEPSASKRGRAIVVAVLLVSVLVGVGVLGSERAAACSCAGGGDEQAFARAEVVFVGEVHDVQRPFPPLSSGDRAVWTFDVSEVFKGDAAATQGLVTSVDGSACGLELPPTGEVVVFARRAATSFEPRAEWETLYASLCDGSRVLDQAPIPSTFGPSRPPDGGSAGLAPLPVALTSTRGAAVLSVGALVVLASVVTLIVLVVRRRRRRGGRGSSPVGGR